MVPRPRVLITRTRHQASALAVRLEAIGAETVVLPTIELAPPTSFEALDAACANIEIFDWLIFTSANAVRAFNERATEQGTARRPRRIAVIGPATLKAITEAGIAPQIVPVLMPEDYVAESLVASLLIASGTTPANFLLVRAEDARDTVPTALEAAGHRVTIAFAYRNIVPQETVPALNVLFASAERRPDIITFTSSSTARNLFALLEAASITMPPEIILASIGPITSATLRELGYEPTLEASEPTIDSLATAVAACF
jgi:uroporphyrinogen-III synthase